MNFCQLIRLIFFSPSTDIRAAERGVLEKAQFLRALLMVLVPSVPTVAVVLTLVVHAQLGYTITVADVRVLNEMKILIIVESR
jgi:hypothetical protein